MTTRLRKVRRLRGSRTHGWGQIGQHRRTGAKGGSGMAGLHKHKWSYVVKYAPDHFGHNAFRPPNRIETARWANLDDAQSIKAGEDGVIDLASLGYDKLLGGGRISSALKIRVPRTSASAIEKVKAAGGSVEVLAPTISEESSSKPSEGKKK